MDCRAGTAPSTPSRIRTSRRPPIRLCAAISSYKRAGSDARADAAISVTANGSDRSGTKVRANAFARSRTCPASGPKKRTARRSRGRSRRNRSNRLGLHGAPCEGAASVRATRWVIVSASWVRPRSSALSSAARVGVGIRQDVVADKTPLRGREHGRVHPDLAQSHNRFDHDGARVALVSSRRIPRLCLEVLSRDRKGPSGRHDRRTRPVETIRQQQPQGLPILLRHGGKFHRRQRPRRLRVTV